MRKPKNSVYLYPDQLEGIKDTLRQDDIYFIDGINSIFVPKQNTTYIDMNECEPWGDLDGEVVMMTPGMAVRTELKRYYPHVNLRARKSDFRLLDISPPNFWGGKPLYPKEIYYYDLCSAYHQIYKYLTLDIAFPRGQGEFPLWPIAQRLAQWKKARNTLIGITRSHTLTAVKGNAITRVRFHNPYFSPSLWATVQHVLHDIANKAITLGAVYVGTDCYMFTRARQSVYFLEFLNTHELEYKFGQGEGEITGWGSYEIRGYRKTERRAITSTVLNNIQREKGATLKWLMKMKKERI